MPAAAVAGVLLSAIAWGQTPPGDPRNIRTGRTIPDEGYCDQPYIVVTRDGHWLCTMTTGRGVEGQPGQHVVATTSSDQGRTWTPLVDIEPADGPAASWAMPLVTPSGRVYVFYDYNGDRIDALGSRKGIRADMLGWFVFKYSDDGGRTWSARRYRMPIRMTSMDRENDWKGEVQMLWGIGKPIIAGKSVYLGFSKIGKYLIDRSEGWFLRSDNILSEPDPDKVEWQMLPEGDIGLRSPAGPIAEEQNLVALAGGGLYTMYRTIEGHPCHAYSGDGGRTWTPTAYACYEPGGRLFKHPRACPRLWKTSNGKYLFWFHNHGGQNYSGRNPAWISGGIETDGRIHWSQPEILLYDPDPEVRMSYPDLVEKDGRFWITQTQKSIARVHEVDSGLLEGLWAQDSRAEVAAAGLVLDLSAAQAGDRTKWPRLPDLKEGGGWTIDLRLRLTDLAAGQVLLDTRDAAGRGVVVATSAGESIQVELSDGAVQSMLPGDDHALRPDRTHQVVIGVDGGPRIVWMVIDGVLCDGGEARRQGWARIANQLIDVNGSQKWLMAAGSSAAVEHLRVYDRTLRISEAVANCRAAARP